MGNKLVLGTKRNLLSKFSSVPLDGEETRHLIYLRNCVVDLERGVFFTPRTTLPLLTVNASYDPSARGAMWQMLLECCKHRDRFLEALGYTLTGYVDHPYIFTLVNEYPDTIELLWVLQETLGVYAGSCSSLVAGDLTGKKLVRWMYPFVYRRMVVCESRTGYWFDEQGLRLATQPEYKAYVLGERRTRTVRATHKIWRAITKLSHLFSENEIVVGNKKISNYLIMFDFGEEFCDIFPCLLDEDERNYIITQAINRAAHSMKVGWFKQK